MTRWAVTLGWAGLVVVHTIYGRVADYTVGRPHWLPNFSFAGVPMSELVLVLAGGGVMAVAAGLLPVVGRLSFHNRFNAAGIAVALGAIKVGLI